MHKVVKVTIVKRIPDLLSMFREFICFASEACVLFARYLDSLIINMDNLSDGEIENVLAAITNNAKVQTHIIYT